jgi:hypothetical protein
MCLVYFIFQYMFLSMMIYKILSLLLLLGKILVEVLKVGLFSDQFFKFYFSLRIGYLCYIFFA